MIPEGYRPMTDREFGEWMTGTDFPGAKRISGESPFGWWMLVPE